MSRHDGNLSLTAIVVQMQKTILQLSARVEALEAANKARPAVEVEKITIRPGEAARARVTMATLCEEVAKAHNVTVADIKGRSKTREFVCARAEFCRLAASRNYTRQQIGTFLDGRDSTSVTYLIGECKLGRWQ